MLMNKILRYSFVALMAMFIGKVCAQEVTFDFTVTDPADETGKTSAWGFPSGSSNKLTEEQAFTYGGQTVKVAAPDGYYWHNKDHYLLLGKQGATLTLPAFDFDVERIDIEGNSTASSGTKQNIFVGETAVSTETTGAQGTNIFEIAEANQAAGNVYVIKVTSKHNNQIKTIKVWKKGTAPSVSIPEVDNIEALTALGSGAEATMSLDKCKVTFVSSDGKSVYVRDNTGGMCFYNQSAFSEATNKWQLGGKITGKVSMYNGMTQFTISDAEALTHTDGDEYQPVEIAIADAKDHVADLVKISNVTVVADGTKYYTDSEKTLQIFDNFKLGYSIADGDAFSEITGVIIPYNTQLEIAPTVAPVATGIENVNSQEAKGAIYNLAGQRVEKAQKGIFIQNGKKFVVK